MYTGGWTDVTAVIRSAVAHSTGDTLQPIVTGKWCKVYLCAAVNIDKTHSKLLS